MEFMIQQQKIKQLKQIYRKHAGCKSDFKLNSSIVKWLNSCVVLCNRIARQGARIHKNIKIRLLC